MNESIESVRVDQIRRADRAATGAALSSEYIDIGIDWKVVLPSGHPEMAPDE